jgi:Cu(I)/Ag(I) efflux system membrane protein CusA/SilA
VIEPLIAWALRNRLVVAFGALLLAGWGFWEMRRARVDAIPDLSENQVIVFADWTGRGPQEVEDQITYPLSVGLQGLAGVRTVRASSMFGFSFITVVFDDDADNYFSRSRVLERLNYLRGSLPEGVEPRLGPDATGLGWIYQYSLQVDPARAPKGGYDLAALRALQDWTIRPQLGAIPGVAEVGSVGGFVRQYQIEIDPGRLRRAGLTLRDISEALQRGNLNVGGKTLDEGATEFVVRGVGRLRSLADIEELVVRGAPEGPLRLRDVARVQIGGDYRRGALDVDGRETVGGIVVMRTGADCRAILDQVRSRISDINATLPPGISLQPFYDRGHLIDRAVSTLRRALVEEVLLVALAHILFLWHLRSIVAVTLPLPLAILSSFILMRWFGVASNIMSLGGLAIAIGVLVDAGIVMTENVIRHFETAETNKGGPLSPAEALEVTLAAARQVGRPIFFAMAIILLAFLPVFALTGQEGRLFHPLAFTKTFAMAAATLLSVTLVPVLCSVLVRGPFRPENRNWVMATLMAAYVPVLDWALERRRTVVASAVVLLAACLTLAVGLPIGWTRAIRRTGWPRTAQLLSGVGSEFMPTLREGSFLFMPVLLPSTSLSEIKRLIAWQDRVLRQIPEVRSAAGKLGRADIATDPAPVEMIETTIELRPESEWRPGMTEEGLIAEMTEKISKAPGCVPGFLHPIEGRILMLNTGVRSQLGVKIFGDNLASLQRKALEVETVLRSIPGAAGVASVRTDSKPYLNIELDPVALARRGLQARDVLDVVEIGLGGLNATTLIEGRQRFPVQVRFRADDRDDLQRVGETLIPSPSGALVPLAEVARIRRATGPAEIGSENGRLRVIVQANVQGRDVGGFAREARARVLDAVRLEPGMSVEWTGQYEHQLHAQQTLRLILPAVVLIIFALLWIVYRSAREAAHVLLAVPFALTGGFLLQFLLGYRFSVAVWVGYIALFGVAIQTGVVMVLYLDEAVRRRRAALGDAFSPADLVAAVREGAVLRLRPKVMTVATTVAGLVPILWSSQVGSEVMRPLAVPVLGGMLSSAVHILVITPVLFAWIHGAPRRPKRTN